MRAEPRMPPPDPRQGAGEPRRRHRPAQRREQIVAAAGRVLHVKGVTGVGLRDIAAAAGTSVGTVTYHFRSVAEIIDLAFDQEVGHYYRRLRARVEAEDDPVCALRLLVDACFTEETAHHWRLWLQNGHRDDGLRSRTAQRSRYNEWSGTFRRLVGRGRDGGLFVVTDLDVTVALLVAVVDGLALRHLRDPLAMPLPVARAHCFAAMTSLLQPDAS